MSRYVTEFVGTFFLVLTIGLMVMNGTPFAPIAIGSVLMAMVYMGGHISGAHYNPAVSVAILIRGKMEARDLIPYVLAQIIGAILASLSVMVIMGDTFAPAPGAEAGLVQVRGLGDQFVDRLAAWHVEEGRDRAILEIEVEQRDAARLADKLHLNDACLALRGTYAADTPRHQRLLAELDGDLSEYLDSLRRAAGRDDPRAAFFGD